MPRALTPAPTLRHQHAAFELGILLKPYVTTHEIGVVVLSPADVLTAEHVMVQPDVFIARLVDGRKPATWEDVGISLLSIEIRRPRRPNRLAARARRAAPHH